MWTPSRQWPLSSRSREMASSKSRASTGSIVTIVSRGRIVPGRGIRVLEPLGLLPGLRPGRPRGNRSGRLNSRMIDSVSTPGVPRGPSTSAITPSPSWKCDGKRTISTTTLSSGRAVLGARVADEDRPGEERAVDGHQGRAARLEVRADELVRLPLEDLDDPPVRAGMASFALLAKLDHDRIARGGVAGVLGGDIDVGRSPVGRGDAAGSDKAEAPFAAAEQAHDPAPLAAERRMTAGCLRALEGTRCVGFCGRRKSAILTSRNATGGVPSRRGSWSDCPNYGRNDSVTRVDEMTGAVDQLPAADQPLHGLLHHRGFIVRNAQPLGDHPRLDGLIAGPLDKLQDLAFQLRSLLCGLLIVGRREVGHRLGIRGFQGFVSRRYGGG